MKDNSIRFINSKYDEQFRIPDGGTVEVVYPDRSFIQKCTYIDDYHMTFGSGVFHICQFAELMEWNGGKVHPEPESLETEGAWQIGGDRHLLLQENEVGWDYSVYDLSLNLMDGGIIDDPSLTINQARESVLEGIHCSCKRREPENYDRLTERITAHERDSVMAKLAEAKAQVLPSDPARSSEVPAR